MGTYTPKDYDDYCERCGEYASSLPGMPHRCKQNRKENIVRKHPDTKKQNQLHNRDAGRKKRCEMESISDGI